MFLSNSTVSVSLREKNTLTDSQLTCCWLDVIKIFKDVSIFLQKHKIGVTDCLALECENSVPSALILLYLLEKGHSFLLLPQTNQPTSIPSFCRYQIIPNSLGKIDYLKKFDRWLKITKNEEYQPTY